jgi:hypothetical protein
MPLPRDGLSNPATSKTKRRIKNIQGLPEIKENNEEIYIKLA